MNWRTQDVAQRDGLRSTVDTRLRRQRSWEVDVQRARALRGDALEELTESQREWVWRLAAARGALGASNKACPTGPGRDTAGTAAGGEPLQRAHGPTPPRAAGAANHKWRRHLYTGRGGTAMTLVALMGRQEVPNHLPQRTVTEVTAAGTVLRRARVRPGNREAPESRRSVAPTGGW